MDGFFLGAFCGFLTGWALEFFRMQVKIQSSLDDLDKLKAEIKKDRAAGLTETYLKKV